MTILRCNECGSLFAAEVLPDGEVTIQCDWCRRLFSREAVAS